MARISAAIEMDCEDKVATAAFYGNAQARPALAYNKDTNTVDRKHRENAVEGLLGGFARAFTRLQIWHVGQA
jgi:hypothetical protein